MQNIQAVSSGPILAVVQWCRPAGSQIFYSCAEIGLDVYLAFDSQTQADDPGVHWTRRNIIVCPKNSPEINLLSEVIQISAIKGKVKFS